MKTDHDCVLHSVVLHTEDIGPRTKRRLRVCKICSKMYSTTETFRGMYTHSDNQHQVTIKIDRIIDIVCETCNVTREALLGRRRTQPLATIRQIAMYLCRESGYNFAEIGEVFNRHYSTVIGNCQNIAERRETDQETQRFLLLLKFNANEEEAQRVRRLT